ncbi:MAG: hypothetical protein C4290_12410 [Chloroflexota bacterium]
MLHLAMAHATREDTAMCTHTWERLAESKQWVCILCGLGPSEQPAPGLGAKQQVNENGGEPKALERSPSASRRRP